MNVNIEFWKEIKEKNGDGYKTVKKMRFERKGFEELAKEWEKK